MLAICWVCRNPTATITGMLCITPNNRFLCERKFQPPLIADIDGKSIYAPRRCLEANKFWAEYYSNRKSFWHLDMMMTMMRGVWKYKLIIMMMILAMMMVLHGNNTLLKNKMYFFKTVKSSFYRVVCFNRLGRYPITETGSRYRD